MVLKAAAVNLLADAEVYVWGGKNEVLATSLLPLDRCSCPSTSRCVFQTEPKHVGRAVPYSFK